MEPGRSRLAKQPEWLAADIVSLGSIGLFWALLAGGAATAGSGLPLVPAGMAEVPMAAYLLAGVVSLLGYLGLRWSSATSRR